MRDSCQESAGIYPRQRLNRNDDPCVFFYGNDRATACQHGAGHGRADCDTCNFYRSHRLGCMERRLQKLEDLERTTRADIYELRKAIGLYEENVRLIRDIDETQK